MPETNQDLTKKWEKKASDFLVGKTIRAVEYMSDKEVKENGWYASNVKIIFTDGHWITPSADDEGNNSGVLFTTSKEIPVIPHIFSIRI